MLCLTCKQNNNVNGVISQNYWVSEGVASGVIHHYYQFIHIIESTRACDDDITETPSLYSRRGSDLGMRLASYSNTHLTASMKVR